AEKESHTARGVLRARGRYRVDHDGCLLALELVDRAHAGAFWEARLKRSDVRIVRRAYQDVADGQRRGHALTVGPHRAAVEKPADDVRDDLDLFGRFADVALVVHGHEPKARTRKGAVPTGTLHLEAVPRMKPPVIKELGGEAADVWMQPERAIEKEPLLRRHGRRVTEQMGEGRDVGSGRMDSLQRLIELLRIAQQDQAIGRGRDGQ